MAKTAKSAKKFVKKHLKTVIACRHKVKPMKNALRRKQAALQSRENKEEHGGGSLSRNRVGENSSIKKLEDMDVDEFMRGDFLDIQSDGGSVSEGGSSESDDSLSMKDEEDNFIDITPPELQGVTSEEDENEDPSELHSQNKSLHSEVVKHQKQLERLKQKDPEFFQFLKEHDNELLEFDDEDEQDQDAEGDGRAPIDAENVESSENRTTMREKASASLSTGLVDAWCQAIKDKHHLGAVRNLLRAFRTACHYGDGQGDELVSGFSISSSHVFNKIMVFTLCEMDTVFRKLLGLDVKEEKIMRGTTIVELQQNPRWKKVEPLVKSYLGNTLHILNQMTDNHMISFTLRRLKTSVYFLTAFPRLARKYLKVVLHFWSRGEGALSIISFLFIHNMAICLGSNYLDACLKGIYKEYAANSKFVNASVLPHVHFMASCVVELYGIDLVVSYQHAFVFIRQLAIILRNALTMKTKESFKNVYSWQYINCLEVWVRTLSTYISKDDLKPLTYPVAQIIGGVAGLVPTARYFPLRLRCVKMLNKLASATGTFIPVATLLLDMLQFKELNRPPTGGVGKSVNFDTLLKVTKPTLKTRAFQEECVAAVVDQLAEHLAQWSYAVSFPELALIPVLGLRRFLKETNVDRFRRQVKQLVEKIEHNIEYVGRKRDGVNFSPKDAASVSLFLQAEKQSGASPLSQFSFSVKQKAEQRQKNLHTASVLIEEKQHVSMSKEAHAVDQEDGVEEEGAKIFSSDWLPSKRSRGAIARKKAGSMPVGDSSGHKAEAETEPEDVLEDLELSSDDEQKNILTNDEGGYENFDASNKGNSKEGVANRLQRRIRGGKPKAKQQKKIHRGGRGQDMTRTEEPRSEKKTRKIRKR